MKHFQRAYLRQFPGLNLLTSLYLVNIQPNLKLHPPPPKLCGSVPERVSNSICLEPTNIEEIIDIINDLNSKKATGCGGVPAKLIKTANHLLGLSPFLANTFNNS